MHRVIFSSAPLCTCCTTFLTMPSTPEVHRRTLSIQFDLNLLHQSCLLPSAKCCVVTACTGYCSISSTIIRTCCTPLLTDHTITLDSHRCPSMSLIEFAQSKLSAGQANCCVVLFAGGYCSISSTPTCTCCTPILTTPSLQTGSQTYSSMSLI
jgi:hypothetical protein